MRYLRMFNENFSGSLEDLKDFTDTCLAYLLDEGFEIQYHYVGSELDDNGVSLRICIRKPDNSSFEGPYNAYNRFKWNDIKDHFIPFVKLLMNDYKLDHYYYEADISRKDKKKNIDRRTYMCITTEDQNFYYTLSDIINDNIKLDYFYSLSIKILDKVN